MKKTALLLSALLLVGSLVGCSSAKSGGSASVSMKDMAFSPKTLEIAKGATVTWKNDDATAHSVADKGGAFKSEEFDGGKTYTYTFDKAGTYKIFCTVAGHEASGMTMEVKVK